MCLLIIVIFGINLKKVHGYTFNSASNLASFEIKVYRPDHGVYLGKTGIRNNDSSKIFYSLYYNKDVYNIEFFNKDLTTVSFSDISNEKWSKISQIVKYGYGYSNHTSSVWAVVTQVMIWQVVSELKIDIVTATSDKPLYTQEMAEIEKLINKDKAPDFCYEPQVLDVTDNYNILLESDQIDDQYIYKVNDFKINKNENGIEIFNIYPGTYELNCFKNGLKNDIFYSNNGQIVIDNTFLEPVNLKTELKILGGKIKMSTKNYNKLIEIANIKYEIYNDSNKLIYSGISGDDGVLETKYLPYGKYKVKAISDIRKINNSETFITIDENKTYELDFIYNDLKKDFTKVVVKPDNKLNKEIRIIEKTSTIKSFSDSKIENIDKKIDKLMSKKVINNTISCKFNDKYLLILNIIQIILFGPLYYKIFKIKHK